MRSLIVAFIIHLSLNFYVFYRGWDAFRGEKTIRIFLIAIFGFEFIVYTVGFALYSHLPDGIVHSIRLIGTSWMFFLLYLSGLLLISDILFLAVKKELLNPKQLLRQPKRTKVSILLACTLITIGLMIYGSYRFNHPIVQQVKINVSKPTKNIRTLRIAMAGDMHLGHLINRDYAKKYVDLIMSQQPDLILFVGDILDSQIAPLIRGKMDEELKRLSAPLGVYSCTGNHEYRFESEQKIQWLNDAGIKMLRDSAVLIDSAFYIVGREDLTFSHRLTLPDLLQQQRVDKSKPIIVLNHNPHHLNEEVEAGADMAFYGHTHHGQAFPGNVITQTLFEVAHGYKKKGDTHIYVTSGIGLVGPQYRVGTVSEVVMLEVTFGE